MSNFAIGDIGKKQKAPCGLDAKGHAAHAFRTESIDAVGPKQQRVDLGMPEGRPNAKREAVSCSRSNLLWS